MTQRRRRSKNWIWWVVFMVLLAIAGVVGYFVWDGYFRPKVDAPPLVLPGQGLHMLDETKGGTEVQTEMSEVSREAMEKKEAEEVRQNEGDDPNLSSELTGVITYVGVLKDELVVRVNIDQYLNDGECGLSLRQAGINVYSETVGVVDSASTSTCAGFNVPRGELPSGELQIVIYLESGDRMGEITGGVTL